MNYLVKLVLLLMFFISSCSSGSIYEVPNDVLRIYLGAEPPTLNVITATDASASAVNSRLFDSLLTRDYDTLELVPQLATHWDVSSDKRTYIFHLRKNIRWHDGKPFTADDVVYSFKLLMDPKTKAPHLKVYFQDMESVTKIDEYTVKFHYSKVYFLGLSICGTLPLVPKHIVEKYEDFDDWDMGGEVSDKDEIDSFIDNWEDGEEWDF